MLVFFPLSLHLSRLVILSSYKRQHACPNKQRSASQFASGDWEYREIIYIYIYIYIFNRKICTFLKSMVTWIMCWEQSYGLLSANSSIQWLTTLSHNIVADCEIDPGAMQGEVGWYDMVLITHDTKGHHRWCEHFEHYCQRLVAGSWPWTRRTELS